MSKFVEKPKRLDEVEALQYKGSYELMRHEMNEAWGEGSSRQIRSTIVEGGIVTQLSTAGQWVSLGTDWWVVRTHGTYYWPMSDEEFREAFQPMDEEADDALEVSVSDITEETDSEFGDTLGEIDLMEKLTELLKVTGKEKGSGTADFILAQFVLGSLQVFEETIKMRAGYRHERWELDSDQNTNEGE
jgi:hypothetical protein